MSADFWNQRFGSTAYLYGTAPNDFVAQVADRIPAGPVLCLAEGEGRNAVFLAGRGHDVTAVDMSAVGLEKAQALAAQRGVRIKTVTADLAAFPLGPAAWSGVVASWAHLPSQLRRRVLAGVVHGLRPGGVVVLEAYTPAQLRYGTGGPKDPDLLMTLAALREELAGLEFEIGHEIERDVTEGSGHTGWAAVVQVLARKPR
jgi:SAM-dependent methyltransferase